MTRDELLALAERCAKADWRPRLKFSLLSGQGWVTAGNEPTIRLLCDLWNTRHEIAAALRAQAAMMEEERDG